MRILAYTAKAYLRATLGVVGANADVLVSPPLRAADVRPFWLQGYDLIYLDLHGQPGSARLWSGEGEEVAALDLRTVVEAELEGAVVFATSCFLPQTRFVKAFLEAGAVAVVGGRGRNWGTRRRVSGAQKLAQRFIRRLEGGQDARAALRGAKGELRRSIGNLLGDRGVRDALGFRVWERDARISGH